MNRREFLQCAALLISGASAGQLGFALSDEQREYLAGAANYNMGAVDYLSQEQRQIVAVIADIIIPRTDTPGAVDAGVPGFIELMAANWFNDQERAIFEAGLADLQQRIPAEYGRPFLQLAAVDQIEILEQLEELASGSPWYEFANVQRDFISDAPFICQLKELTIWGFFTSEAGSTQVLRYEAMPMYFDGEAPLKEGQSTWAVRF